MGSRARLEASGPEPAAGAAGAAEVRVSLPSGSKLQRRFPPGATVGLLADFVVVASEELGEPLAREAFDLTAQAPPRRTFATHDAAAQDGKLTLVEAGLDGAALLVKRR